MRIRSILPAAVAVLLAILALMPLAGGAATSPLQISGHLGSAASVPTVSVPSVTVPTVSVPSVSTPVATTPAVTRPAVTTSATPKTSTPTVKLPTVQVPSVTVPGVKTPAASTPTVTTPAVSTPPASTGSTSGQSGQGPGSSGSSTGAPASGTGSPSSAAGVLTTNAPAATVTHTSRPARGAKRSSPTASSQSAAKENRDLRGLVSKLHGCLGSLTTGSRRLLSLRAGIGGAPQSATAVARALYVSTTREGLLEQLALVELQSAASSGCAGASAAETPTYAELGNQLVASVPWLPVSTGASSPASSRSAAATSHSPVRNAAAAHSPSGVSVPAASRTVERSSAGSHGLPAAAIALFAVLLLALSLLVLPATRRQLLHASARGFGAPPKPEPSNPVAQPEAEVGSPPGPERGSLGYGPGSARPAPSGSWAREHAAQAALVVAVIAGGAARLFTRGRGRGGRR
jgi:hypothetical protein